MIAVLKPDTTEEQKNSLIDWLKAQNVEVHESRGKEYTVLGLVGNTGGIDVELVESLSIVDSVKIVSDPFKKSNRKFHPENSMIRVGDIGIGDGSCVLIAGPGPVESREQIVGLAKCIQKAGAAILKGDAVHRLSSPYDQSDPDADYISLLLEAKKETGMPVMSEISGLEQISRFEEVDLIQVATRSMQNYELLRELGRMGKPVVLKRGLSNRLKELLVSAEYIMAGGNENVILCERGIRSFETYTRNTLDLSAVPMLHELSHLPVLVDPGRATGSSALVDPLARAAAACGADGLIIDVHQDPLHAPYDGARSLTPDQFAKTADHVRRIREVLS